VIIDYVWIAIAIYGIFIQAAALGYARDNFRVAHAFVDGVLVMARARLQTNWVRMSAVSLNFAIGVASLVSPHPRHILLISAIIAFVFVANEVAFCWVATVEVRAHRQLRSKR
jgi:hypothetical protein